MSCFVVSHATMDVVVSAIADEQPGMSCENMDRIGRELFQLNWQAFVKRYQNEPALDGTEDQHYSCQHRFDLTPVQKLKGVQCLLYQCSEGEQIQSTILYSQLKSLELELLHRLARSLPEYDTVHWDWPERIIPAPSAVR